MKEHLSKKELDALISEKYTLGEYYFDEEKKCFFGNMEINLYLREIDKNTYKSCEYYYCDGYECEVEESEQNRLTFSGSIEEVKNLVLKEMSNGSEQFMGYLVIETNISVFFEMIDKTLYIYSADGTLSTSTYE